MQDLFNSIGKLSHSDSTVLLVGESGTGKELVARAIYEHSERSEKKLISLNMADIPIELLESELFGYEKGAFTGAVKSSTGKFEQAQKGTLFLDEIGDMPADLQTKLLRVLENSVISKVGSNSEIKLDVRIVCATHKNLNELVASNKFREDLLFRLNVFPIEVPNLSERHEDIPEIIEHFIQRKSVKKGSDARPIFEESALNALQNYDWPGNIREVRNIVERAIVFFPKAKITEEDVKKYLLRIDNDVVSSAEEQEVIWSELDELGPQMSSNEAIKPDKDPPSPKDFANWFDRNNSVDLRSLLRDIEIVFIEAAMDRNGGNTSEAAKDLKLIRTTLIEKIRKYGI